MKKINKPKKVATYIVYQIIIDGTTRYIGLTNNMKRRQRDHRRLIRDDYKKEFYDWVRMNHPSYEVVLEPIQTFPNRTEGKRYEAMLILQDHFSNHNLIQSVPKIKDM